MQYNLTIITTTDPALKQTIIIIYRHTILVFYFPLLPMVALAEDRGQRVVLGLGLKMKAHNYFIAIFYSLAT